MRFGDSERSDCRNALREVNYRSWKPGGFGFFAANPDLSGFFNGCSLIVCSSDYNSILPPLPVGDSRTKNLTQTPLHLHGLRKEFMFVIFFN